MNPPEAPSEQSPEPSRSRRNTPWAAVAAAMIFLIVVLVFILQNLKDVKVTLLGGHWSIPLGIDLLLAAVLGGLVVFAAGVVRMSEMRRVARRRRRKRHDA